MRPNRGIRVIDTKDVATDTFEEFHKRGPRYEIDVASAWPTELQEVGTGHAELYRSNKWKRDLRQYEDYKHIVEGTRTLYVEPGWLVEWANVNRRVEVYGPMVTLKGPLPQHVTRLGQLLSLQVRLFRQDARGRLYLPEGDDGLYEVVVSRGYLAAAHYPDTNEPFLCIYDKKGIHAVLTGEELDITEDGIVG